MKTKVHSFLKLMVKPLVSALVFISFVLLGGAVILARNSDVAALRNLKAGANDKKLTATNWDILIEYIAGMDAELQSLKQSNSSNTTTGSIPAGAVMAFDLSACPSGWTRFSAADNRFIMGSTSNSKETGGKSSVMLAANQIAPHSHWMVDSFFAESYGYTGAPYWYRAGVDTVSWNKWLWSNKWGDYDNQLQVVWRKTWSKVVSWPENVKSNTPGKVTDGAKAYDWQSGSPDYGDLGVQQSVNIQNPYIKLIYCKKN